MLELGIKFGTVAMIRSFPESERTGFYMGLEGA
jgi:hypothetical protein